MTQTSDRREAAREDPTSSSSAAPSEVDTLVSKALRALAEYEEFDQERVDHIVKKASVAALDQHTALALLAVEETGRRGGRRR